MANEKSGDLGAENRRLIYQQLCESYRAIDSFRTALLGLLPLVSGAGAFLLLNDVLTDPTKSSVAKQFLGPIGVFGFVITLGLFFYEIYGIRKCGALINAGKHILRAHSGPTDNLVAVLDKLPISLMNHSLQA